MIKKKQKEPLNFLKMIPEKCYEWEKNAYGLAVILKPKFSFPLLRKHLVPRLKHPYFKISLDEKGSFLWEHIDGYRTIEELSQMFKARFGDKAEPLFERLRLFFQQLEHNCFIRYSQLKN
jgi:hypothetical protein